MGIIKVKSRLDEYRHRAKNRDLNELSGRAKRQDLTAFVNREILKTITPDAGELVVDIGCGDGTLLRMVDEMNCSAIGILPTDDEVERVQAVMEPPILVRKGLLTDTGLDSAIADKVVCNGVLLLLENHEIDQALNELARIAKQEALIFIGEIPSFDEIKGKDYGDSIIKWLLYVYRTTGMKNFRNYSAKIIKKST